MPQPKPTSELERSFPYIHALDMRYTSEELCEFLKSSKLQDMVKHLKTIQLKTVISEDVNLPTKRRKLTRGQEYQRIFAISKENRKRELEKMLLPELRNLAHDRRRIMTGPKHEVIRRILISEQEDKIGSDLLQDILQTKKQNQNL